MIVEALSAHRFMLVHKNTTAITVVSMSGFLTVNNGLITYSIPLPLILMKLPQHINNLPLLVLVFI